MGTYVKAATTGDLGENSAKLVEAEGKSIALINAGGNYYAIDNTCTHVGGPLCEGSVEGEEVVCPWHGARFDLKSGQPVAGPARENVACYQVRVEGDEIQVEV